MSLAKRLMVMVSVAAVLSGARAMAAVDAYMLIQGASTGAFRGSSEKIELLSVKQESNSTSDSATGMASGKRQHADITITKKMDVSSAKLAQVMKSNEVLHTVTIVFAGGSTAGRPKAAERIVLGDAMITSVQMTNGAETLRLNYRTIEVTYANGGKTAADDWEVPR